MGSFSWPPSSVEEVLRWIASDNDVVPQAVACLAALAYKTSSVRIADWRGILDSLPVSLTVS